MNTTTLNRTVLAALVGSVLTFGWGAPTTVQAQSDGKNQDEAQKSSQFIADADEQARRNDRQARKGQNESSADAARDERASEQAKADQRGNEPRQAFQQQQRQADQQQRQADQQRQVDGQFQHEKGRDQVDGNQAPRFTGQQGRDRADGGYAAGTDRNQTIDPWHVNDGKAGDRGVAERGGYDDSDRKRYDNSDRNRYDGSRDERIEDQRRQAEAFAHQRDSRRTDADRWSRSLQSQHRSSGYRYQQDYYSRLSRQRYDWQNYDYYSDPYFNSAPSYRYYRSGNSYYINNYAADLLRQAINYGYREGIRAGQADRYDGWQSSYRDAYAYQDASYGYRGMYVDYDDYSYYFREGFRRGYEDGYYDNRRYGRSYNGSDNILQTVLSVILDLRPYR